MKFLVLALVSTLTIQQCLGGATLDMLNGMQQLMTGGNEPFDPVFYERLVTCLNKIEEPRLLEAVDAQWAGFLEYSNSHGTETDPWPTCNDKMRWFELNCTIQEYGSVSIYEPCNYASNVAYYYTVAEICDHEGWTVPMEDVNAMAKTFAILAQGSSFMHGSNTNNGGSADVRINDLFTYVAYQAAVRNLGEPDNAIIHDLNYTARQKSGAEWTDILLDMYIQEPVANWGFILDSADFPSVREGMCSFFATAVTIFFPPDTVDLIISFLFDVFNLPEDMRQFCLIDYIAEVRAATSHIELSLTEKGRIEGNTIGTALKLVYAFVWQEEVLVSSTILLDPLVNMLGALFLPYYNDFATALTSFSYSDPSFQHGVNMYPGEEWCNPIIPHAKWHLQTGIALADFVFLADEINRIIVEHAPPK